MTRLERLLQTLLSGTADREYRAEIGHFIQREARTNQQPLARSLVLDILAAIPSKQPFTVIFRKKNDDIREMHCILDRDKAKVSPKVDDATNVYKVWDREANAPRAFCLDRVYEVRVANFD